VPDVSEQLALLKLVAARLEAAGVRYIVSGSTAMNFYAEPRMIRDIDIVVELEAADAGKLVVLLGAEFYVDEDTVAAAIARRSTFNAIHMEQALKIDFIVRKNEPYRMEELSRRRRVSLGGVDVWSVSAEDLILSKLLWARESEPELQLRDVRNLLASTILGWSYLDRWAASLSVADLLAKARS
jgi:predicted nucleotidyltransferase